MVSDMTNNRCSITLKTLLTIGCVHILSACSSSSDPAVADQTNPPGSQPDAPASVFVVSGDDDSSEVRNTISWALDPDATDYTVYWDNAPGVTDASSVVVPAQQGTRHVVHSDVDVVAGGTYYYRVQASTADGASALCTW